MVQIASMVILLLCNLSLSSFWYIQVRLWINKLCTVCLKSTSLQVRFAYCHCNSFCRPCSGEWMTATEQRLCEYFSHFKMQKANATLLELKEEQWNLGKRCQICGWGPQWHAVSYVILLKTDLVTIRCTFSFTFYITSNWDLLCVGSNPLSFSWKQLTDTRQYNKLTYNIGHQNMFKFFSLSNSPPPINSNIKCIIIPLNK